MAVQVVELLLAKGSNKEHRNISDYTPLSQAASGGYVNVIKVLLAHGAEINSRFAANTLPSYCQDSDTWVLPRKPTGFVWVKPIEKNQ